MRGATPAQAARFARALDALAPPGMVALAVSGGGDSLALLLLAQAVRPGCVTAATVDHRLRPENAAEARMVAQTCRGLGVPHATLAVTVEESGGGRQAAARAARYAALERWATDAGAVALATAHHADDQAETILLRLARGAGIAGLAGVRAQRPLAGGLPVVRPLLAWRRAELAAIAAAAGLRAVDDPSNRDPRYDRTRARALLAGGWPEAPRLAAAAQHLADAEEALAWVTERLWAERAEQVDGGIALDPTGLPVELRRRLVARALHAAGGSADALAGPDLTRLIERLESGEHATLAGAQAAPGARWRFAQAAPHRPSPP